MRVSTGRNRGSVLAPLLRDPGARVPTRKRTPSSHVARRRSARYGCSLSAGSVAATEERRVQKFTFEIPMVPGAVAVVLPALRLVQNADVDWAWGMADPEVSEAAFGPAYFVVSRPSRAFALDLLQGLYRSVLGSQQDLEPGRGIHSLRFRRSERGIGVSPGSSGEGDIDVALFVARQCQTRYDAEAVAFTCACSDDSRLDAANPEGGGAAVYMAPGSEPIVAHDEESLARLLNEQVSRDVTPGG